MDYWRGIKEYKGKYSISDRGRIRNNNTQRILKPLKTTSGYYFNCLVGEKSSVKNVSIHRLVGKMFILNPKHKPGINHINGIKTDNRVENLEWCTHKENCQHAKLIGLIPKRPNQKGEKHPASILKEIDVLYIRKYFNGKRKNRKYFANMFGVKRETIKAVVLKRSWKHI